MTGKLKRYLSLDVLRGLAIIGVFSFHIMNLSYDYRAVLIGDPGIIFYILLIPLYFIGEFDVLFTCLSATVNTISIDRNWEKIMKEYPDDPNTGRKHAFWRILKTQLIRGLFIILLAYVAEVLLNGMLLRIILGDGLKFTIVEDEVVKVAINEGIKKLFRAHILWLIGIGLIVTSFVYLLMKRKNWSNKKMVWTFVIIAVCTLFIFTPFLQWLYPTLGFPDRPQNLWITTSMENGWGLNVLRMILAPFIKDDFPFFPDVSIMFIGVIIGFVLSKEKVEKKHLNRIFFSSLILFVVGALIFIIEVMFEDALNAVHIELGAGIYLMTSGGALLAMLIFVYLIDIRRGRKNVKFFYFQRFGTMSLTLWMLQWVMVFPIMLLQWILNLINGTNILKKVGPFFQTGLDGYGVIGEILYILLFWSIVLWLWQKIHFVGSFEWMTVKLMSGKRGHDRAKISDAIVNAESLSDPPQKYYNVGMIILFFVIFLVFCVLYTALGVFIPDMIT